MYLIGTGMINDRTIGKSAQGLVNYVLRHRSSGSPLACAIGYDTRHRSRHFARLCAEIMVTSCFQVYFLDGYHSIPALVFTVRTKGCACGIMISANHNPPWDNAVKVSWSSGRQLQPLHDNGVMRRVRQITEIDRVPFEERQSQRRIICCQDEIDATYHSAVLGEGLQARAT